MSNNNSIDNTNVNKIREEVTQMLEVLSIGVLKSEKVLENKFQYLFKTSPTLFKYIIKNHNVDKDKLNKNIDLMLNLIFKIQTSEISQHDASVVVGEFIGKQYIPQLM